MTVFTETDLRINGTATVEFAGITGFIEFVYSRISIVPVVAFEIKTWIVIGTVDIGCKFYSLIMEGTGI